MHENIFGACGRGAPPYTTTKKERDSDREAQKKTICSSSMSPKKLRSIYAYFEGNYCRVA